MLTHLFNTCNKKTIPSNNSILFQRPEPKQNIEVNCGTDIFTHTIDHSIEFSAEVTPQVLDFYCIIHLTKGSAWYWSEATGRQIVNATQIVVIPPQTLFDFAGSNQESIIDSISFYGSLPDTLFHSSIITAGISAFGSGRKLLPICELLIDESQDSKIRAAVSLTNTLTDNYFEAQNNTHNQSNSKIQGLIDQIVKNPEKYWDSQQMAQYCNLSEVQLRRVFKKETGHSPKVYLDTVKMNHAAQLLKREFSVGIVSDLLGYSDQFHFSRRFKSILGLSPREYLQQNR